MFGDAADWSATQSMSGTIVTAPMARGMNTRVTR